MEVIFSFIIKLLIGFLGWIYNEIEILNKYIDNFITILHNQYCGINEPSTKEMKDMTREPIKWRVFSDVSMVDYTLDIENYTFNGGAESEDKILRIYSGSKPKDADDKPCEKLLCEINLRDNVVSNNGDLLGYYSLVDK